VKSSPTDKIRVLIADDHPVVREGLGAILRSDSDITVVAEATNGEEACNLYDLHDPDIVMLDLRMPKKDGLQVINELIASRRPKPRIIVMMTYETEEDIRSGNTGRRQRLSAERSIIRTDSGNGAKGCRR
jgi:two-component system, NarL family, response regulator